MKIVAKEASPELIAELEQQRRDQEAYWKSLWPAQPYEFPRHRELREKYAKKTLTMAEFKEYFGL